MSADLSCPVCGSEFDLAVLFKNAEDREAWVRMTAHLTPLRARLAQYVMLFKTPKHQLSIKKMNHIALQVVPDIERGAITWKGREWAAPLPAWAQAIDQMLAARDAQRLELPMKGHGYLYAILAGMADKHEASAEQQREQQLRTGPRAATTNGPASVAALVQQAQPAAATRPAPAAAQPGTSPTVRAMREHIAKTKGQQ